jgi:hypothetical protein
MAKQRYDPKGLLNPGKMITFKPEDAAIEPAPIETVITR